MKISLRICGVVLGILLAAALTACGSGTSDTTAPSSVSVMIDSGAANTSSTTVILSIAATDNIGVTGYYISETSTTPSAMASGWTLVHSTIPYSADVPLILSSGDGTKTIYVWFKDGAGNVSAPATASITLNTTPISMITPYKNSTDMAETRNAFSSSASAPWRHEHNGIDFMPNGNLKPFQAVCSGVVDMLELYYAEAISEWHVNLHIKYNDTYSVMYLFEPGPLSTRSDAETQLANIRVSLGQHVSQGDIIGNLYYTGGDWAFVHFGLLEDGVWICPEPYFTSEARDSILTLLHVRYPGANMCYSVTLDTTAPSSVSAMINSGAASTPSTTVILSIAATDDIAVTGYYISETSTTPSAIASGWTLVASTISYSADVPFILSSGDGTKTIYVWFKDDAGNVSAPATASITLDTTPISLITPYKNSTDMACIPHAFSSSASAPWLFEHPGIDCWPKGNFKPFQAVCPGVVNWLELWGNATSDWHVEVGIKYNDTYSVLYLFETGPGATRSDAEAQLADIQVSLGQHVSQGDIIGYLHMFGDMAWVDFGLIKDGVQICPEPYFTPEARDSILSLLHVFRPGANMCY